MEVPLLRLFLSQEVMDEKFRSHNRYVLVKWKEFPNKEDWTWEVRRKFPKDFPMIQEWDKKGRKPWHEKVETNVKDFEADEDYTEPPSPMLTRKKRGRPAKVKTEDDSEETVKKLKHDTRSDQTGKFIKKPKKPTKKNTKNQDSETEHEDEDADEDGDGEGEADEARQKRHARQTESVVTGAVSLADISRATLQGAMHDLNPVFEGVRDKLKGKESELQARIHELTKEMEGVRGRIKDHDQSMKMLDSVKQLFVPDVAHA